MAHEFGIQDSQNLHRARRSLTNVAMDYRMAREVRLEKDTLRAAEAKKRAQTLGLGVQK